MIFLPARRNAIAVGLYAYGLVTIRSSIETAGRIELVLGTDAIPSLHRFMRELRCRQKQGTLSEAPNIADFLLFFACYGRLFPPCPQRAPSAFHF